MSDNPDKIQDPQKVVAVSVHLGNKGMAALGTPGSKTMDLFAQIDSEHLCKNTEDLLTEEFYQELEGKKGKKLANAYDALEKGHPGLLATLMNRYVHQHVTGTYEVIPGPVPVDDHTYWPAEVYDYFAALNAYSPPASTETTATTKKERQPSIVSGASTGEELDVYINRTDHRAQVHKQAWQVNNRFQTAYVKGDRTVVAAFEKWLKEEGARPSSTKDKDWFNLLTAASAPAVAAANLFPKSVFPVDLNVLLQRCREKICDSSNAAAGVIAFVKSVHLLCADCVDEKNHDQVRATFLALVLRTELVVDGRALPNAEDDIEDRLAGFIAAPTARFHTLLRPDDGPIFEDMKARHAKMRPASQAQQPSAPATASVPAKPAKAEADTDKILKLLAEQAKREAERDKKLAAIQSAQEETTGRLVAVENGYKKSNTQLGKIASSVQGRQPTTTTHAPAVYPAPAGVDTPGPQ